MATLLLLGCGGGGNDTPPPAPTIQGSNLVYGSTATFQVGVTSLNPGVSLSVEKCPDLAPAVSSSPYSLAYSCRVSGSGSIKLTATDAQGKVLASQTFTVPAPRVQVATSMGIVVLELNPNEAPTSVDNFLRHVSSGFYSGTIFHRVIPNFVVQAGGFTAGLTKMTAPYDPIALESNNGLSNLAGTLAMARTSEPNSATSQFYINLVDNKSLDYASAASPGYAVFGKVVNGIDAISAIGATPTSTQGGMSDVPTTEVTITSMTRTQ